MPGFGISVKHRYRAGKTSDNARRTRRRFVSPPAPGVRRVHAGQGAGPYGSGTTEGADMMLSAVWIAVNARYT